MKSRASYHTTLKELVFYDLLPSDYLKSIPRANINRWRNDDYKRFKGSEINEIADNHTELIKTLNHYPRMFKAYGKLIKTLIHVTSKAENIESIMRDSKEQIVNAIINTKKLIPISKAIELFSISKTTFHTWVIDTQLKCKQSYFKKCNRIYSNQVTPNEVKAVKTALMDKRTLHWSIRSVHAKGITNGDLSVSENTMYKINRILGIRNTKNRKKKKRHKQGVRAEIPNQIWHADITKVRTLDHKLYCVYLVMDNYSRYILSYAITEKVSGMTTKKTLEEAYEKARKVTKNLNVNLIVDGGPENNNIYVNGFIEQSEINIRKLIALKDIKQSNSMVERVNMTLKYGYIFPKDPRDLKHLTRILQYFINDYNNIRPHGKLKYSTPHQMWIGKPVENSNRTNILKQARTKRLAHNKQNRCQSCLNMN